MLNIEQGLSASIPQERQTSQSDREIMGRRDALGRIARTVGGLLVCSIGASLATSEPVTAAPAIIKSSQPHPLAARLYDIAIRLDDQRLRIEPVDYEPGRGQQNSFPWIPIFEENIDGSDVTAQSVNWEPYDIVDQAVNGPYARISYSGYSTRAIVDEHVRISRERRPDAWAWLGDCDLAAIASWFLPRIEGEIEILPGVLISEWDRLAYGTKAVAGVRRYPIDPSINSVNDHFLQDYCVLVDFTPFAGQEWYGVVRGIDEAGMPIITKYLERGQRGVQTKYGARIAKAYVVPSLDESDPSKIGSFNFFNKIDQPGQERTRSVVGAFLGTHQIIDPNQQAA